MCRFQTSYDSNPTASQGYFFVLKYKTQPSFSILFTKFTLSKGEPARSHLYTTIHFPCECRRASAKYLRLTFVSPPPKNHSHMNVLLHKQMGRGAVQILWGGRFDRRGVPPKGPHSGAYKKQPTDQYRTHLPGCNYIADPIPRTLQTQDLQTYMNVGTRVTDAFRTRSLSFEGCRWEKKRNMRREFMAWEKGREGKKVIFSPKVKSLNVWPQRHHFTSEQKLAGYFVSKDLSARLQMTRWHLPLGCVQFDYNFKASVAQGDKEWPKWMNVWTALFGHNGLLHLKHLRTCGKRNSSKSNHQC